MNLHLTKKVQEKIKVTVDKAAYHSKECKFLEDWYVNIFTVNRKAYFIYTEAKPFYSIVKDSKCINCVSDFIDQTFLVIGEIYRKANVKINLEELNSIYFNSTNNKVVLGSQVDLIKMAKYQVWDNNDYNFEKINETPMSYISTSPENEFENEKRMHLNATNA